MNMEFSSSILYWVLAYVAFLFFIGLVLAKSKSPEDYLMSGRKLGYVSSAMTIIASKIGGGFLVTTSVLIFTYGLAALTIFAGFIVGFFIFYFFAIKLQRESMQFNYYTLPDFFLHRSQSGGATTIVILSALSMFGWVLTNFIAGGKLLSMITGVDPYASIIIVAIVILVYIYFSGFNAVVKTDALQFCALIVLLVLFSMAAYMGISRIDSIIYYNSISLGEIAAFFVTGILFPLGSAELWERVYAIKDRATLRKSLITSSMLYTGFGFLMCIVCMYIKTSVPNIDFDTGLIYGLNDVLGGRYVGLIVIAFASAILSSADTFVYSTASILGNHFSKIGDKAISSVTLIRRIVILVVLLGAVISITLFNIIDVTYIFVSFTVGLALITISTLISTRIGRHTRYAGAGLLITIPAAAVFFGISALLVGFSIVGVLGGFAVGFALSKVRLISN